MRQGAGRFLASLRLAVLPALATAAILYMVLFLFHGFQIVDEGVALVDAWRIADGQVPHRDFFEIIPPLSSLPTALLFRCFGPSLIVSRTLAAIYGLLLIFLTERLVCSFTRSLAARAMAIAFLIPFGTAYWPIPSHHWVADLACMGSALCLLMAVEVARPLKWSLAAGALAGVGLFTLQDQGLYFVAGVALLYLPSIHKSLRSPVLLGWCSGVFAVTVLVGSWLLPAAGASALLEQWLIFPLQRYGGIAGNETWAGSIAAVLRQLTVFSGTEAVHYQAIHLATVIALLLMPLLAMATLCWALWRAVPEKRGPVLLLAALCLAHGGAALHRLSLTNLVWALPPMLVAVSIPSGAGAGENPSWTGKAWRWGMAGLAGLVLIFGGLFVGRTFTERRSVVSTQAGVLWVRDAVEAESLQGVVTAVQRLVPPAAPLFCRTPVPLVNFLCLRANPTPYTLFVYPGYNTEAQAGEVQRRLVARPDAWVLDTGTGQGILPLDLFLGSEYEVAWDSGYARLLRRRSAPVGAGADSHSSSLGQER